MLAYYDTFAGLVPCRLCSIDGPKDATVKLTATRGAYKRGEIIQVHRGNVVARRSVIRRKYSMRLIGHV